MARKLAPILHISKHDILKNLDSGSSGFAYLARGVDLTAAGRIRKLGLTGDHHGAGEPARVPGGQARRPGHRDGRGRRPGAHAASRPPTTALSAPRTASSGWCSTGSGRRSSATRFPTATDGQNIKLTIDAAIQARTEDVLANVAQTYQPVGRDRDRDEPAQRADPRDGQLADGRPEQPGRSATHRPCRTWPPGFTYEPGSTFKAFTVAGALDGASGHARAPCSTCRSSSRWPTGRSRTPSRAAPRASRSPRSWRSRRTSAR